MSNASGAIEAVAAAAVTIAVGVVLYKTGIFTALSSIISATNKAPDAIRSAAVDIVMSDPLIQPAIEHVFENEGETPEEAAQRLHDILS